MCEKEPTFLGEIVQKGCSEPKIDKGLIVRTKLPVIRRGRLFTFS